jgi:hypothetical protein
MRTTEDYRATLANWRQTAPANDHDILPSARPSGSPRHDALSADLAVLLRWRALRNPEPALRTDWSVMPANENVPSVKSHERAREIFPSESAMMQAISGVELAERQDPVFENGQRVTRTRLVPIDGDIERGNERWQSKGVRQKYHWAPIARLGNLRFSELHYNRRQKQFAPLGALTHCNGIEAKERMGRAHQAGVPAVDIRASALHVADIMGVPLPRYRKGGRPKRAKAGPAIDIDTTHMTFAEARTYYGLSPVERDPRPVLPAGSRDIASQFLGLRIGSDRKALPDMAAPASELMEAAETTQQILTAFSPQDVRVLDLAVIAPNFREVGEAFGSNEKAAERRGKRLVLTAAKNLAEALKKIAA